MNSTAALTGAHLRTYQTIFQHPVSHNLGWLDVHSLMRAVGQVDVEANGNLKVTRNGQTFVIHPHRTKDVPTVEELMAVRHFLEQSETVPPAEASSGSHWLLVIDHHEARLFRSELRGAVPERILPHAPEYFRHTHHSLEFARGQEKPDPNSFFGPIAAALPTGATVLVFGAGTGRSSEMDQFVAWLKVHHADKAAHLIGAVVVDEHHLTTDQLLAKAREFYAHAGKTQP